MSMSLMAGVVMLGLAGTAGAEMETPSQCANPAAVVVEFLALDPSQAEAFQQMLIQREQSLAPIHQQIAVREQQIQQLIASGGDPAAIGVLVVEVHQLRQTAVAIQAQFLAGFGSLLNPVQAQRWQAVRLAAQLQPVLPAFQALRLM